MTVTCPEGHRSSTTDYCDTCGSPIGAGAGAAAGGAGASGGPGEDSGMPSASPGPSLPEQAQGSVLDLDPPAAAVQTCPHCGGPNVADALFCEACGYDFTTGAAPLDDEPPPTEREGSDENEDPDEGPDPGSPELLGSQDEPDQTDGPGGPDEPADQDQPPTQSPDASDGQGEPDGPEEADQPDQPEDPGQPDPHGPDEPNGSDEPEPDAQPATGAAPEQAADPDPEPGRRTGAPQAHRRARHTPPSRDLADTWVVEVWVDPDWYAVQQTEEACPSPSLPDVVMVRRNVVLVGRPSGSLGVRPDVDAGADSAVSRRHAQLTSDGRRWWIEDLGSSNGTYVGTVGEPLPTEPLPPGQRLEIDRDDRIYVGAWTRLVLRQATGSERAGQG